MPWFTCPVTLLFLHLVLKTSDPLPLHTHCSCPVVPWSYTVRFYDLELSFLPFGEETKAHVTMLFLKLSENKLMGTESTE